MSRHQSLLVCFIIIFLHNRLCPEAARPGSSNKSRITNGEEVPEGYWPFMAALFYEGEEINFCGGSVLNDDSILTAAHCMFLGEGQTPPEKMSVYLGHVDLGYKDENYLFQVEQVFVHEQYNPDQIMAGSDLAVLKLARKIDFSALDNVDAVCLPEWDAYPEMDQCVVMGWGQTEWGVPSSKLLDVDLSMLMMEECWYYNYDYDPDITFCAGNPEEGKDSCFGDSGGPLVCLMEGEDEQPFYLQYGIVSYGVDGSCGWVPGFYTRVRVFVDWIKEIAEA